MDPMKQDQRERSFRILFLGVPSCGKIAVSERGLFGTGHSCMWPLLARADHGLSLGCAEPLLGLEHITNGPHGATYFSMPVSKFLQRKGDRFKMFLYSSMVFAFVLRQSDTMQPSRAEIKCTGVPGACLRTRTSLLLSS